MSSNKAKDLFANARDRSQQSVAKNPLVPSGGIGAYENKAIETYPDGSQEIKGFQFHKTGLQITDDNLTEDEWKSFGEVLLKITTSLEWMIGDWLVYGLDTSYGDKVYEAASNLLGKNAKTLEGYAYVARNVQFSQRCENLSIAHHRLVCPHSDDPDLQGYLLSEAEKHKLSVRSFNDAIPLMLENQSIQHLLPKERDPVETAAKKADNLRNSVKQYAVGKHYQKWLEYAEEQAQKWSALVTELKSNK